MIESLLTFKNLSVFNLVDNADGKYTRTPEGSELDELESMYLLVEWLVWAQKNQLVDNKRYLSLSCYLNTIPSVGEYLKNLSERGLKE